jgi:hypothetical protein
MPMTPIGRIRNRIHSATLGMLCTSAALLCSAVVAAAPDDAAPAASGKSASAAETKKKAMEHFETGLKLYEDGDFSLALIEFERAYSYIADYRVLYNIGQVSIQLGRYARAALALQQYLKAGGAAIPAARGNSVRDDLKMLEGRTAHLQIESNVQDAEILLDDVRLAKTPIVEPLLVDAGEHRLTVQKPGYVSRTERLVLAGRDESKLQIDLAEEPKSAPIAALPIASAQPPPRQTEPPPAAKPMSRRTQLVYVGAGATGLLVVGWAVTGYVGIKAAGNLHDALQRPATQSELDTLKHKARGWLLASDIVGATALVTGGTTLYFALKGPSQEQPKVGLAQLGLGLGPGAVQLTGAFH